MTMYAGSNLTTTTDTVTLTNMVDAIDGATGFGAGESSTTHSKYANKSLKLTGNASINEFTAPSEKTYALNSTHIYYARVETYQETVVGTVQFYWPIAEPAFFASYPSIANTWNINSAVNNRSSFTSGNYQLRLDYNNLFNSGEMWFDGLMLIDLTEAFGAGKEPDKAWCDAHIPYFIGTTTIQIDTSTNNSGNIAVANKKGYGGIANVSRILTDGYCGVNNVVRKFFRYFPSEVNTKTENNSGGNTVFDVSVTDSIFRMQIASDGSGGAASEITTSMDRARYYILVNAGDVIEYTYEWYLDAEYASRIIVVDYGNMGGTSNKSIWTKDNTGYSNGLHEETESFTILDGYSSFYHTLYVDGSYEANAYINVKSIKINGEQVFPV